MPGLNRCHTACNGLVTVFPDSHGCDVFFRFVKNHILISITVLMTPEIQNKASYIAFSYVEYGVFYVY